MSIKSSKICMAGAKGLEPSAFCVTGRRYNQLNYAPANFEELNIGGGAVFVKSKSVNARITQGDIPLNFLSL